MRLLFVLLLVLGSRLTAGAASNLTVQDALKLLPKDQVKNLVHIEGREGAPIPERWYIQVYDANEETGVREFVIAHREIITSRGLSQFLPSAKPEDVIGTRLVKINSDDLIKLTQEYVEANGLEVTKVNYTLFKEPDAPVPVWKMTCFDDSGKKLGELVVNARNANVVSHEGFELAPGQTKPAAPAPTPATPPPVASAPSPATMDGEVPATPAPRPAVAVQPTPSPTARPLASASPAVSAGPTVLPATAVVRSTPAPSAVPVAVAVSPTPKPKPGGLFQRVFRGKPSPTP